MNAFFMEQKNKNYANSEYMVRTGEKIDSKRIWEIRNHPLSRQYSGNPEAIPWKQHQNWFERKYFAGADNHFFVLEKSGEETIGYCRLDFDSEHNHYIVSVAIDPQFHGQGLGNFLLSETIVKFNGSKNLAAEIQKENIVSVKLFQKNNFKILSEDEKNYYLKYTYLN